MKRLAMFLAILPFGSAVRGADPPAPVAAESSADAHGERDDHATAEHAGTGHDDPLQREHVKTAAVLLLAGIAATGGLAIVFIVLWGFRVRRNIRRPLPKTRTPDELWYLRRNAPDDRPTETPDD